MLERIAYTAGEAARRVLYVGSAVLVALIMTPAPLLEIVAVIVVGTLITLEADALGSLLAALLVRARILEFRLGPARPAIRFRIRRAQVSLGLPFGHWMEHGPAPTGRRVVFLLAGPVANLVLAGVVVAVPVSSAMASSLAVLCVARALEALAPTRAKNGQLSAGAQLLEIRPHGQHAKILRDLKDFGASRDIAAHSPERAGRVLAAYQEGVPIARANAHLLAMMLRREGRIAELMELHEQLPALTDADDEAQAAALAELEWTVMTVPGVPVAEADRAAGRLEQLPRLSRPDRHLSMVTALALARLRQGRFADVEPLCTDSLAGELEPDKRARVLATVILARRALRQPYQDLLAEAVSISTDDDLVAEAAAPETMTTQSPCRSSSSTTRSAAHWAGGKEMD